MSINLFKLFHKNIPNQLIVQPPRTKLKRSKSSIAAEPIFQAAFPPLKHKPLFKRIIPFIFLPLGLYKLSKKVARKFLVALVELNIGSIGHQIFPAPHKFQGKEKKYWQNYKKIIFENPKNACSSLKVKSADGLKLDGAILWADRKLKTAYETDPTAIDLSGKKWIVCFNGNAMCYENYLSEAHEFRSDTNYNVLLFNYRGVMDSEGHMSSKYKGWDLILDGDAFIQYLLSHGVKSEDILIHGFSLGGGVGTDVRALHSKGPITSFQSFSSIVGVIKGLVHRAIMESRRDKTNQWLADKCAGIVGFFAGGVLKEAGWEFDSASKWNIIEGYKWIVSAGKDDLITGQGKLYYAVKQQLEGYVKASKNDKLRIEHNKVLKAKIRHVYSADTKHGGPLTEEAYKQHVAHIKAALG